MEKVFVYPELNRGILQQGKVVDGSTFYLLRTWNLLHGDTTERISIESAVAVLCKEGSPFQRFSEHYFRYVILPRGEGVFWGLSKTHIYFRSIAKVARTMACAADNSFVEVPAKSLLKNKSARATLYVSIEDAINRHNLKPLSREKLAEITGIPRSTQKVYDADLNRQRIRNFGVVGIEFNAYNAEMVRQTITQDERPLFAYKDRNGMFAGGQGKSFIAYEIPSSRVKIYTVRRDNHISRIKSEYNAHDPGAEIPYTRSPRLYYDQDIDEHKSVAAASYSKNPREIRWFHERRLEPDASVATRLQGNQYWGITH